MSNDPSPKRPRPPLQRVLFAGGGTGGHVYMAVALRSELQSRGPVECLFVGTARGLEMKILPPLDFPLQTIDIGGIQNLPLGRKLAALFRLPGSFRQSLRIIRGFRPRVIVGLGGYSSGPVLAAGRICRYPCLLIEPNVVPGLTNRLLARWVQGAAVAFEETRAALPGRTRLTGIPVRPDFHRLRPSAADSERLHVLVFGGSRGSRPLNRIVCEALSALNPTRIQICHQTGPEDFEEVRRAYQARNFPGDVHSYLVDMPRHFGDADLIVSRSGASTVAEITAAGRASILIPFPHAADDHQTRNAEALASRGAAILLPESETDGPRLAREIQGLEKDRAGVAKMGEASRALARPRSAKEIVDLLEEVAA